MENGKKFLASSSASLMGDICTEIAAATLLYTLTHSSKSLIFLLVIRTAAVFCCGILVPFTTSAIANKRNFLFYIDIIRALLLCFLFWQQSICNIYFVIFINSLLGGFYNPFQKSGIQNLIQSETRMKLVASLEAMSSIITFTIPLICGAALSFIHPAYFFLIDGVTFLVAGNILMTIPKWGEKNLQKKDRDAFSLDNILDAYKIVLFTKKQRNLLFLRFILLFSLSSFDVLKMTFITKMADNIAYYQVPKFVNFGFILGLFSACGALAMFFSSLFIRKQFSLKHLNYTLKVGIAGLALGLLMWIIPLDFHFCWIFYLVGCCLLSMGLSFSKVGIHTYGYELTDKSVFVEVVSSADALSRLWQSIVTAGCAGILIFVSPTLLVLFSSLVIPLGAIPIINRLSKL